MVVRVTLSPRQEHAILIVFPGRGGRVGDVLLEGGKENSDPLLALSGLFADREKKRTIDPERPSRRHHQNRDPFFVFPIPD